MLVRGFAGVIGFSHGVVDPAWSLCCQQYKDSGSGTWLAPLRGFERGTGVRDGAKARRQGRPCVVIPLHVVPGFLESERGSKDSGVLKFEAYASSSEAKVKANHDVWR
jgi:hypothetical protein